MRKIVTLAGAALLAACGGGGGSETPAPSALTFNADAAMAGALTKGVTLANLQAGSGYSATLSYAPGGDGAINGVPYKTAVQTATINRNGAPVGVSTSTLYYSISPVRLTGASSGADKTLYTAVSNLPVAGIVGQTGTFNTGQMYLGGSTVLGAFSTSTTVWSLEADSATTAWACLTTSSVNVAGSRYTGKDCYRIDAAGNISGAKMTTTVAGQVLTFQ